MNLNFMRGNKMKKLLILFGFLALTLGLSAQIKRVVPTVFPYITVSGVSTFGGLATFNGSVVFSGGVTYSGLTEWSYVDGDYTWGAKVLDYDDSEASFVSTYDDADTGNEVVAMLATPTNAGSFTFDDQDNGGVVYTATLADAGNGRGGYFDYTGGGPMPTPSPSGSEPFYYGTNWSRAEFGTEDYAGYLTLFISDGFTYEANLADDVLEVGGYFYFQDGLGTQNEAEVYLSNQTSAGYFSYWDEVNSKSYEVTLADADNGYAINATGKVIAYSDEDEDSDTDDVLTTTIDNAEYGLVMVRESGGTEACMFMIAGGNIEKISSDATFTVTKDNAATYNVYFEDSVIKIQNKVGDNKNLKASHYGMDIGGN